jgi:hypothetical protein
MRRAPSTPNAGSILVAKTRGLAVADGVEEEEVVDEAEVDVAVDEVMETL